MKSSAPILSLLITVFTVSAAEIQTNTTNFANNTGSITPASDAKNTSPVTETGKAVFTNSLGMKFVPVPVYKGNGSSEVERTVLVCQWQTRVKDYQAFCDATGRAWPKPPFPQTADHPAVNISWDDANAFCEWLSQKEGKKYRLPTDHEWSCGVGIGDKEDPKESPVSKKTKLPDEFPWGTPWPPPRGVGNYFGTEIKTAPPETQSLLKSKFGSITATEKVEEKLTQDGNYHDGFVFTSPVGSFPPNKFGLYDMGGNVWQWCQDAMSGGPKPNRVLRGAMFLSSEPLMMKSAYRSHHNGANWSFGFRVALDGQPLPQSELK
jgi:formylglycine-generating enzyme required for sulfatase activity